MMIRVATEEDWPSLRKMVGFLDAENVEHRQQSVERDIVAGMLHAFATGQEIVVAEADGGELVGFCAWVSIPQLSDRDAMGLGTWVSPRFQRSGMGRSMRELAQRHLEARGVTSVVGVAAAGNKAGLRSCTDDGFVITGYVVRKDFRHEATDACAQKGRLSDSEGRQSDRPEVLLTHVPG